MYYLLVLLSSYLLTHKGNKSKSSTLVRIQKRRGGNYHYKDSSFI